MQRENETKTAALIIGVVILILSFWHISFLKVGIYIGCHPMQYLYYPFFHANILHALLNVWTMLSVVFYCKVNPLKFIICYIIAVLPPDFCLQSIPTIGLSGFVFALLGSVTFCFRHPVRYIIQILLFVSAGLFFNNVAVILHLWCFFCGLFVSVVSTPIKKEGK